MKKKKLPILSIMKLRSEFGRFMIQDDKKRVWTGEQFDASSRALLYANSNDACLKVHDILKKNFEGVEPKRYVVPCFIEVFSHEPVSEGDIAKYLSDGAILSMDTDKHGNGPGNNSLVLPVIDWRQIAEIEEFPHD